ncbi:MAG: hypothetical protein NTZ95_04625, partial [Candidatus Omnitrophica bacterium]|nr:hypothetical protein [Candidatus Omnitrophota bacterium]
KDVHPTRDTAPLLRRHCEGLFKEGYLQKCVIGMELFYLGMKTGAVGQVKSASGQDRCQR